MSHKVHSAQGNVPFSWENKPGVCKVKDKDCTSDIGPSAQKLPPPPCPPESVARVSFHDLQVPLPPCGFQPPTRSSSKKGLVRKQDDPFLTAYREVTKSATRKGKLVDVVGLGFRKKKMSLLSCKHSITVREDSMVRICNPPPQSK